MDARDEAIANADAQVNNFDLPLYSDLLKCVTELANAPSGLSENWYQLKVAKVLTK